MPAALQGSPASLVLPVGYVLTVTADAVSNGRIGRLGDQPGARVPDTPSEFAAVAAGATALVGPFPYITRHTVEALAGSLSYAVASSPFGYSMLLGAMRSFTGARTLRAEDNGRVLRCDDGSAVVVTVPNDLPEGFNVGLAMWGAGTVTVTAGSGATKRSSTSALSTQYGVGSLLVMKNSSGSAAEFVLGGDFA
jgi:hypothetical protein